MAQRSSKKQQELLEFIDGFIKEHGYGPSYREVMSGLGYKSVSTVAVHINGLLAKGYIRKKDNSARSIEIISMQRPTVQQKPVDNIYWLQEMIQQRITKPDIDAHDKAALLRAAELLGVPAFDSTE